MADAQLTSGWLAAAPGCPGMSILDAGGRGGITDDGLLWQARAPSLGLPFRWRSTMSTVLNVLLPIFGLILIGYICRRTNRLGPTAASEMNRFVVWLGLPALLFSLTAKADWAHIWQPGFLLAFTGGMLAVFLITLAYRWKATGSLVDASIDGLSAGYANTGYIGIPLCVLVLGDDGMAPALIASLMVVCVLFGLAVVCIEVGLQSKKGLAGAILQVFVARQQLGSLGEG